MNPYHFQYWGGEHAVIILLTFLLPIFSIRWSKGQTELHRDLLGKGLAVMLVANWCTYQGYRMYVHIVMALRLTRLVRHSQLKPIVQAILSMAYPYDFYYQYRKSSFEKYGMTRLVNQPLV